MGNIHLHATRVAIHSRRVPNDRAGLGRFFNLTRRVKLSDGLIVNPQDTGCPEFPPPHRERYRLYQHIRHEIVDYVSLVREGGVSPAAAPYFRTSRTRINGWSHRVLFLEDSVSAGLLIMHSLVCAAVPYSWNQST